jgi:hypothetical protein
MDDPITVVLLVIGAAAWAVAIGAGLALARHRRADISLLRLWFDGLRWFKRDTFRPEAAPLWRVFVASWLVLLACFVGVALRDLLA